MPIGDVQNQHDGAIGSVVMRPPSKLAQEPDVGVAFNFFVGRNVGGANLTFTLNVDFPLLPWVIV